MCVEGNVDDLLVVTKTCLLILNVKEARERMLLKSRAWELHFLGQSVKLDGKFRSLTWNIYFVTGKRGTIFSFSF